MGHKAKSTGAKHVAEMAGVSRSAVSRAFNPEAYLAPQKRERILAVAKELGYHPNMAARAMVSQRSHLVAVILPALHPWESQELDALTDALQAMEFATLVYRIPGREIQPYQLSHLRAYHPDSVIVYSDMLPLAQVRALFQPTRPILPVYADDAIASEAHSNEADVGFDRLIIDQRQGTQHALRLLAGCGCKRLAWLTGAENTISTEDRRQLIYRYAGQYGLEICATIPGDFTYERAREEVRADFLSHGPIDGLIAANDVSAFGAIDALRHDLNLSVPDEVKVVGFDNISQSAWKSYDLTTVGLNMDERIRALVRLIRNRLANPSGPMLSERIEAKLIVRGTVA